MRRPRVRFTARGLIIASALVGLNLAAAIATSKDYPRMPILETTVGNGRGYMLQRRDGGIDFGVGNAEVGWRRTHLLRRPPPPTLLQCWSPVVAAASITLLVLSASPRSLRLRTWARRALIAAALVGLNLAAVASTSRYYPRPVLLDADAAPSGGTASDEAGDAEAVYKAAIRHEFDPSLHEPPTSLLRIWSPVIAAATSTLLILVASARRSDSRSRDSPTRADR